jgi:hypothetical protein
MGGAQVIVSWKIPRIACYCIKIGEKKEFSIQQLYLFS